MICVLLAEGFEETEALTPYNLLRRANLDVRFVGLDSLSPRGTACSLVFSCSMLAEDLINSAEKIDMLCLPGGMPGAANLDASPLTDRLISKTMSDGGFLCAICAAPMVYGKRKLLAGVKATCFPGFEKHLTGALLTDKKVVRDRKFITAAGMGAAFDYGIELVSALCGEESASTLRQRVQAP